VSHSRRLESSIAKASHTLGKPNVLFLRCEICLDFLLLLLGYSYRNDQRTVRRKEYGRKEGRSSNHEMDKEKADG
jgi:hypothetical protein